MPRIVATRICDCGKEFGITRVQSRAPHKCYCSRVCFYMYRNPRPTGLTYNITEPNAGWFKPGTQSGRPFQKGQRPENFKEQGVGYDALHDWINRHAGPARCCEHCGATENIHWANKSGEYERDLSDWMALCVRCHRAHDRDNIPGAIARKFPEWAVRQRRYQQQYRARKKGVVL